MTNEDRPAFLEVVVGFAELKGRQLSAPALELYWRALCDWELEEFRTAAAQLLRTCEFMPVPKDFEDLRRAGRLTAGEAFAWFIARLRGRAHLVGSPSPEDTDLIERTVRALGGWDAIGRNSPEYNDKLERRFCEHYENQRDADEVREAVPQIARRPLPGPVRKLLEQIPR